MTTTHASTILFADVSGSTRLFEQRGDVAARRIIASVLAALSEVVATHGGRVIKTIGDEIMVVFPGAIQGLLAAVDMHRRIDEDVEFRRDNLAIRIGLHHGDTLLEDGDVYGDAVNVAARMTALAKRQQIVTTASTLKSLTSAAMLQTRSLGQARVAGKQQPIEIVDVLWQNTTSHLTMVQRVIGSEDAGPPRNRLLVRYRGRVVELDEASEPFTLGRDASNDLVIEADWISRNHAMIEYKRGHFMLSDRSTNGTYIKLGDDDELHLHRDEFHLRRTGTISLGQTLTLNQEHVLYFQCSEA